MALFYICKLQCIFFQWSTNLCTNCGSLSLENVDVQSMSMCDLMWLYEWMSLRTWITKLYYENI